MRWILVAMGLMSALCDGALADAELNCYNMFADLIPGNNVLFECTQIIDGKIQGDRAKAYRGRGDEYVRSENYDKAILDYNQAVRLDPQIGEYYAHRGIAYVHKGDYNRAIQDFDQAITLTPNLAYVFLARGVAHGLKQDHNQALKDFDYAIQLSPTYSEAYSDRALAYWSLGKHKDALIDFDRALAIEPSLDVALEGKRNVTAIISESAKWWETSPIVYVLKLNRPISEKPLREYSAAPRVSRPITATTNKRIALVIGNSAYKDVSRLPNARNDARAIAASLIRLGFEVIAKDDLSAANMRAAFAEFETRAANADWALVYYAGHGIEMNGRNWLLPTDAKLARASDIADEAMALDRVLERVRPAKVLRMVILDACRNNPFVAKMDMGRSATRSVDRGLARIEPQNGEVVFYAARDGSVAADGDGINSPFASAFVKHLDEDGLELSRFFRRVTGSVRAATKNVQEPFVYGTLPDVDFYFKPPKG